MTNPTNNNDFFDLGDQNELDRQIADRMSKPSLAEKMDTQKHKNRETLLLDFWGDVEKYWYIYVFLFVSAVFTGTLGVYMGLSPQLDRVNKKLVFQTDFSHVVLAIVYLIAFITVTEIAFAIMKWLYFTREETNTTQRLVTLTGMVVSGCSILGTGIAGGMVIASNIAFLTEFMDIPAGAQKWVVIAIPSLITTYTFLVSAYSLSSSRSKTERILREQERNAELTHRTRIKAVEQIGREQLQVAEIRYYQEMVMAGRLSKGEAEAAIRAGRTLGQEETRQGRDIDGKGGIGNLPKLKTDPTNPPR